MVLVHGRTDDGKGLKVLRKRADELYTGEVRPLEDGKPISGEVVSLRPRPDLPLLCDVEVHADTGAVAGTTGPSADTSPTAKRSGGPAQVSSEAYRSGWDRMWGQRKARKDRKDLN